MNTVVRRFEAGPEAAAQALGWKWAGREGSGPCPACGEGEDRGWVHAHRDGGGRITVSCRRCNNPDDLRAALDRILGPESPDPSWVRRPAFAIRKRQRRAALRPARKETAGDADRRPDGRVERAWRLWTAGEAPEGTQARRYLVGRRAWPPEGPDFPPPPPSVRWIPARRWPQKAVKLALPDGAAGVIAFAFEAPGGDLRAVSVDALDEDGTRLAPRWRRTVGTKTGARFLARNAPGGVAVIVEGEVTALAASLLLREDPEVRAVFASGGKASIEALALDEVRRRSGRIRLLPDDDQGGREAADRAALAVRAAGFPLPERTLYPGGDAADALAVAIGEREAIRDTEAENPDGALQGAWTDVLRNEGADG